MIKNTKDLIEILNKLPYLSSLEEKEDKFVLYFGNDLKLKIQHEDVKNLIKGLNSKRVKDETIIYEEYSFEVLIKFESPRFLFMWPGEKDICLKDSANEVEYKLSSPTKEYWLFILDLLKDTEYLRSIFRRSFRYFRRKNKEEIDFFEFFTKPAEIYTLKISSVEPMNSDRFSKLATAFLFNLSYNLDVAIIEVRFLHELSRYRIIKLRRSSLDEIEPPRRFYITDLVYHYQMAISTDSIPLQFLSFYHVIEHFFHNVFDEELINTIREEITSPDFSYKRKKDINNLIKLINKKMKYKNDEILFDEQNALFLTIKKYVNLDNLKNKLQEYDTSFIEYYKKNKVSFSKGSFVDFSKSDNDKIFKSISDRIYKTRNAIVHSKEGDKPKYIPFKHDKELVQEIPLIRFISEEIIINTSKVIE